MACLQAKAMVKRKNNVQGQTGTGRDNSRTSRAKTRTSRDKTGTGAYLDKHVCTKYDWIYFIYD